MAKNKVPPPPTGTQQEALPTSDDEMEEAPSGYIPEVAGHEYDYAPWREMAKIANSRSTKATATRRKNGKGSEASKKRAAPGKKGRRAVSKD